MGNTRFPESRILSVSQFIHSFQTGCDNRERFCFILGSGASVDSGIPMGGDLENEWMRYLMGEESESGKKSSVDPMDTRSLAEKLKKEGKLQYNFQEIEEAWERIKEKGRGRFPAPIILTSISCAFIQTTETDTVTWKN